MKDQELIDLLKLQAKELADFNTFATIVGYGNTMLEAANRLELQQDAILWLLQKNKQDTIKLKVKSIRKGNPSVCDEILVEDAITKPADTMAQQAAEAAQSLQKEWGTAFKERLAVAERLIEDAITKPAERLLEALLDEEKNPN